MVCRDLSLRNLAKDLGLGEEEVSRLGIVGLALTDEDWKIGIVGLNLVVQLQSGIRRDGILQSFSFWVGVAKRFGPLDACLATVNLGVVPGVFGRPEWVKKGVRTFSVSREACPAPGLCSLLRYPCIYVVVVAIIKGLPDRE